MYTEKQKQAIAVHLRNKFMGSEVEDYEIVITLMALIQQGKIIIDDVKPILETVYFGNLIGVITALEKASKIIDDKMLNTIINKVKGETLS